MAAARMFARPAAGLAILVMLSTQTGTAALTSFSQWFGRLAATTIVQAVIPHPAVPTPSRQ